MDYDKLECSGCGVSFIELLDDDTYTTYTEEEVYDNGVVTDAGNWYCLRDCLREGKG